MATIVRFDQKTHYVLLGTGHGAWASLSQSFLDGTAVPTTGGRSESVVAVCDSHGRIGWFPSNRLEVVSVDGQSPRELLASYREKGQ